MRLDRAYAGKFATRIAAFAALHFVGIQTMNRVENRITVIAERGVGVEDFAHSAHGSTVKDSRQQA
jgi:hypothetical protein